MRNPERHAPRLHICVYESTWEKLKEIRKRLAWDLRSGWLREEIKLVVERKAKELGIK